MNRTVPVLVLLFLAAIVCEGCNGAGPSGTKPVAAAPLPSGWTAISDTKYRFSLGLPPGWTFKDISGFSAGPPSSGDPKSTEIAMAENSSDSCKKTGEEGIVARVDDPSAGFTLLTVTQYGTLDDSGLDQKLQDVTSQLKGGLVDGDVSAQKVTLPGGPAYEISFKTGGSKIGDPANVCYCLGYVFAAGKSYYKALFFSKNAFDKSVSITPIMQTFRAGS